jgi:hypothetical protein
MSQTDGRWTQDVSVPDGQFFIGASEFFDTASLAARGSAGAGLFSLNLAATQAGTFFANLEAFIRTGVYATTAYDQEQYGTAASVPGPSTVAGTSGPEGITGFPPTLASAMATLIGPQSGPVPKGTQIDSIDVIYGVYAAAATVATIGLTKTVFSNAAAPVVSNLIALGANGLTTTTNTAGQVKVINVPIASPAMIISADSELVLNVNLTAGAGGTVSFYGVVIKCHFNWN